MQFPEKWLQGKSLGEKISCVLRLRIIDGSTPSGTVLSENMLASEFGTSRSPIRDALKILSNEGLIQMERMGAVVLGLTPQDLEELYDVRFMFENFAMQKLAIENDETTIQELSKIIDKMEMALRHSDPSQFAYHDLEFHETIVLSADHKRISYLWINIRHVILAALLVATERRFSEKEEILFLIDRHKRVVEALVSRDVTYINRIVKEHYHDTKRTVEESLFKRR
ncbi:FCD domain-containing protein [Paenibacillus sp. LMG 31461]|uniref:FCD domain-containing protein n=1 Tax=Paenibacillus plantarum TaxID=2654975 RepID=A0ABX1XP71_9BACL|nr:GntR family transcriptional regulator [Paenibacillus plantarum]NOU69680.1 FCD domain-containing protein [Paenibacillus plantarum]